MQHKWTIEEDNIVLKGYIEGTPTRIIANLLPNLAGNTRRKRDRVMNRARYLGVYHAAWLANKPVDHPRYRGKEVKGEVKCL